MDNKKHTSKLEQNISIHQTEIYTDWSISSKLMIKLN